MGLYHRTNNNCLKSIMAVGLLCKYSNYWKGHGGCIYLSKSPQTNFGIILLSVESGRLNISVLSDWEYICWENITVDRIRIIGEINVNKLCKSR